MAESPAKKLKEQLEAAMAKERLKEATELLLKLERLEPDEPKWSHRAGDLFRRLSRNLEAVQAYERAVDRYAKGGFLARAVAMAKTITSLDASRKDVLLRIQQDSARGIHEKARASRGTPGALRAPLAQPAAPSLAPPEVLAPAQAPAEEPEDEQRPTFVALAPPPEPPERKSIVMDLDAEDLEIMYVEDDEPAAGDDGSEARTAERLAIMPLFALFAEVPHEALMAMAAASELIELEPGREVLRAGDAADALYAIVAGSVRVVLPEARDGEDIELGEGEVFGEACLLTDEPRHADVYAAEGGLSALRIPKETLDALVEQHDEVGRLLTQLLVSRLITNLMRTSPLFGALDPDTRREVVALFELRRAPHGTVLLEAQRRGDGLYIPLTGQLHLTDVQGDARVVPAGTVVGTSSLLSKAPYPYTVITLGDMLLLRLPTTSFLALVTQFPTVLERLTELAGRQSGRPSA